MVTIIVTGGAGFIGSNFVRLLLAQKKHPVVFDKLTYAGNRENIPPEVPFVQGDITDRNALEDAIKTYQPTAVVNFAAESHVDRSIHGGAAEFVRTNVMGVQTLLDTVKVRFVQVSTDEVYGDTPVDSDEMFSEQSPLRPSSPYSASKAAGDLLCMAYHRTYGTPVIVTRGSNTYGPYHYPEKVIPFFILKMMEGKKMPVYGSGANIRDWMYVEDHCSGILAALESGTPGQIYNIASDEFRSNLTVAHMIAKAFGHDPSTSSGQADAIEFVTDRPGHDLRYAPDASKIKRELGWSPTVKFEDGLARTIEWFKQNTQWVENVKKRSGEINTHITI